MTRIPQALLLLATLAVTGFATAQKRAESTSKQTSTHRVVVVNGKTIVDEKTVDGRRVPSKGVDAPLPGLDPQKMIRELRDRMRKAEAKGLPLGDATRSSHTRRVVVENGKTIVDEESRDGRPVKRGRAAGRGGKDSTRVRTGRRSPKRDDTKRATKKPTKILRRKR